MIFHDVEPLSEEWRSLRLGLATASNFHKILTPKKLELSDQSVKYMAELLAEWITGEEIESYASEWMNRGLEVEDRIWKAYEGFAEVETSRGGFYTTDDAMIGASPDRLVGTIGDLEAKAPMLHTQVLYALGGIDDAYMLQLQGRLWIHKREWVDIFSWHPQLFIPPHRVYPIEKYQKALGAVLPVFVDQMLEARLNLERRFGPFVRVSAEPEQVAEAMEFVESEVAEDVF